MRRITVTIIFSLLVFSSMYVAATMNAIDDSYQQGLDSFKMPFLIINLIVLGSLSLLLVIVFFSNNFRAITQSYLISFGVATIATSSVVFVLGFAPCLKPHPTTEPHITHHNLNAVVTRSILCPRYSNRSYPGIIIYASLGLAMVFLGRKGNKNA